MKQKAATQRLALGFSVGIAMLGLSACDVDQTKEGELPEVDVRADAGQIPKYEVDVTKTQEGKMPTADIDVKGGQMPAYEVHGPDVEIGTKEVTITVPDVDVELPGDDENPKD